MKRIVGLAIVVCSLFACKKDPYTGITVYNFKLMDSSFTRSGYYLDSNNKQVPFSNTTKTPINISESIGEDIQPGFHYCVARTDTFWWSETMKHYGKPKPKHFAGDYVSIVMAGDSVRITGDYQSAATWKDTYVLSGKKN